MTNIRNFPIESRPIGEVTKGVLEATGKAMCERLDGKAEAARQAYHADNSMRNLASWILLANRADSARITYNGWKRGKA
jgi:hypothetical protein